jgi:hypothetical protein
MVSKRRKRRCYAQPDCIESILRREFRARRARTRNEKRKNNNFELSPHRRSELMTVESRSPTHSLQRLCSQSPTFIIFLIAVPAAHVHYYNSCAFLLFSSVFRRSSRSLTLALAQNEFYRSPPTRLPSSFFQIFS